MEVSVTVLVQTKNTMAVGETDRVPVRPGNRQERIENMANIISDETIEYVGILANWNSRTKKKRLQNRIWAGC